MALYSLFTSDVGLFSLFVIAFIIVMAGWFIRFFNKKMAEEESQMRSAKR